MMLRFPRSCGVLLGSLALLLAGCGDDGRNPGAEGGETGPKPIPAGCRGPAEGCPCSTDVVAKCAETVAREGDTVTCRQGERSCVEGKWSECVGEKTSKMYSAAPPLSPGVRPQDLATSSASCMDVCDPYCQLLADTPDGFDPGMDFTTDATGVTLYTAGFTGGNCPDLNVTPPAVTLEITQINTDGTVVPDTVALAATCGMAAMPVTPTWSHDQPDRAAIGEDGMLRVFSGVAGDVNVTGSSLLDTDTSVVSVVVNVNEVTGISVADQTLFTGAGTVVDVGKTLYPYRETVFPLDMKSPLVQWETGGSAATQVQVALRYPAGSATPTFWYSKIVAGEPNEPGALQTTGAPSWRVPQAVWNAFDRTAAGDEGEIIIQRRAGATLYQEMIIPVTFASAALRGTVYYTQYLRKLFNPAGDVCAGQTDLPGTYNPLAPAGTICPVGNCTHVETSGASTTRAIDLSNPAATNVDPFNGAGGCPVCHSVSAQGNVYVAGSRFLQEIYTGTSAGFVNGITATPTGAATFSVIGEAPNYAKLPNGGDDWDSRGFGYAPLTPDGALALQGFYTWGNTGDGTVANNLVVAKGHTSGGQQTPMFFVPTANTGHNVQYATTAALAATRSGNVLTASAGGVIPTIDGQTMVLNATVLVKNQVQTVDNGIYYVSDLGTAAIASQDLTTSALTGTASSAVQPASRAFDNNNTTTFWQSNSTDSQWIYVDLGSSQAINRVRIDWGVSNARNYVIQTSNDATTWSAAIVTVTNNMVATTHRINDHTGLTATGRYVRMSATLRNTNTTGYQIYEMDVYGPFAGTPYKLTRRSDADDVVGTPVGNNDDGFLKANAEVRVTRGIANYGHVFRLTSPVTNPVVNTNGLVFTDTNSTPLTYPMATPTISPDGTKLAYVTGDADTIAADSTAWRKGITMANFNQTARTVTGKKRILNNWNATTGGNPVRWPFFESDSRSLVYVENDTTTFCSTESPATDDGRGCMHSVYGHFAPTTRGRWPGRLFSIDTAAGTPSTTKAELSRLNDAENTADADRNYQPTVLPIELGGYRWVIFTSPRSYGNQLNQVGTHFSCGATLLWVSALDAATATTTDRSHPAFLLPGQNLAPILTEQHYVNERGYLVPSPCKAPGPTAVCSTSDECCGTSKCAVDTIPAMGAPTKICKDPAACSAVGGACLTDDDCCGDAPCVNSECVNIPNYMAGATFERVYEAECPAGFHPLWGLFSHHLTTTSDSHIEFDAQTALTLADLATADVVDLDDSTGDNYGAATEDIDVGDALIAEDVSASLSFLQISITLHPTSDGSASPILHDWEQRYSCVPAE